MPRAARLPRASTSAVRPVAALLLAVVLAVSLAACTSPSTSAPTTAASIPSPSRLGDGVLKIGTLFPSTGATAFLGAPQLAAVKAAVASINAAGGVNGAPVQLISADSGDAGTKTAEASLASLVKQGVDVVIGPSSSVLAQRLLTAAAAAQVPVISPSATYPQLSTLDTAGVFFRTIPSTAHQGVALGRLLPSQKQSKVALIASGDLVGQSIVAPLDDGLQQHGGRLVADITLTASSDAAAVATQVAAAKPDAVVLDTQDNGAQTKAVITRLVAAGLGGAKLWLTSGNLADYSQALPAGTLAGVRGILEGAATPAALQAAVRAVDPTVSTFAYVPEAYDATILVALAATLAHDDQGMRVAAQLQAASVGGIKCTSWVECLDVLESEPAIDYDGVSGALNLDGDGDPTSGSYGVVAYAATNRYTPTGSVTG